MRPAFVALAGVSAAAVTACSASPAETTSSNRSGADFEVGEPSEPATPTMYLESEFRDLVAGKTREEIVVLLGAPLAVYEGVPDGAKSYNYSPDMTWLGRVRFRVKDDVTGLEYKFVTVHFDPSGTVKSVNF